MRAVVTGMIATYPVGGVFWDYAQYLLGLERLGFEVWYLEDTGEPTYDPGRLCYGDDPAYGIRFLAGTLGAMSPSAARRWHFRDVNGGSHGVDAAEMARVVASADLLLNVSGGTLMREAYLACPRKVLIDTDPGWNHFVNYPKWDRGEGWTGMASYRAHDHFFTYGERIGRADCAIPSLGIDWLPTRPPVIPELWSGAAADEAAAPGGRWTTVMTWNTFRRPIEHEGAVYGSKEVEFAKVETLPSRLPDIGFEIAIGGHGPPGERLRAAGWRVVDSHAVSVTAEDYRRYILGSRGEFSVAKNVYVATRSGWFSCRSVCYLAAGLPVVLQDTGFSEIVPTGEGLLAFSTPDEAVAAIRQVEAEPARHRAAACEIARTHFGHEPVLRDLLRRVGLG